MELRQADLRFTDEEAAAFLNRMVDLSLTADDVAALNARTEGWVTGLQMAALGIATAVNGHKHTLLLPTSSPRSRDRIATCSIISWKRCSIASRSRCRPSCCKRRSWSSCAVRCVTQYGCGVVATRGSSEGTANLGGLANAQDILEYLERANLFIVPLDDRREWYRYHRLFSDLLRQRLRKTFPDAVSTLHRRASAWYASNGDMPLGH